MKRLVQKGGFDINEQDQSGRSPIHIAACVNAAGCIKALSDAGAEIDVREAHYGRTALALACRLGNAKAVSALITAGADASIKDSCGWNALHLACGKGNAAALKEVLQAESAVEEVDAVVEGWTPLHLACAQLSAKCCTALLRAGANTEMALDDEWTPFDIARSRKKLNKPMFEQIEQLLAPEDDEADGA